MTAMSGEISGDDFVRSITIGVGGFSKVVACMHAHSKTWLAMKETNMEKARGTKLGLSALRDEIEILSVISKEEHPCIVNLHFAFQDGHTCSMALDLHHGGDLRYHMRNKKVYREKTVAFYAICLSSALHFCHERGILHRDIKPENVILDAKGYPYLTDFGVSSMSSVGQELISTSSSGTREYLASEVLTHSHRHGVEADFWSLGVMLYELVYGRRPWKKHVPMNMIYFQEDLQEMGVTLSSTSCKFAHSSISLRQGVEAETPSSSTPSSGQTPSFSSVRSPSFSSRATECASGPDHASHVSATIRDSAPLARMLDTLRLEASQDNNKSDLPPPSTYDPRGFTLPCVTTAIPAASVRNHLPKSLRVEMPQTNSKNRTISPACISVLEGLLDVRLWARLGAGYNYTLLQEHSWFREQNICWDRVLAKKEPAAYTPNLERISRELQFKYGNEDNCFLDECETKDTLVLCKEEEEIVQNLCFIADKYQPRKTGLRRGSLTVETGNQYGDNNDKGAKVLDESESEDHQAPCGRDDMPSAPLSPTAPVMSPVSVAVGAVMSPVGAAIAGPSNRRKSKSTFRGGEVGMNIKRGDEPLSMSMRQAAVGV